MKKGTHNHPKVWITCKLLGVRRPSLLGHLELLWDFTSQYAPQGDIGRYPDERIEAAMDWSGKRGKLLDGLVQGGWIERHPTYRLVVHDWHDHCNESVRKLLQRRKIGFVAESEGYVETVETMSGQRLPEEDSVPDIVGPRARALPMPMPEPQPMPEPEPVPMPAPKPETHAPLRFGTWTMDPTYECFVELYRKSGALISDDDLSAAHFTWRTLDFEQKQQRCERLSAGLDAGEWSDPKYIPLPKNFLQSVWKRPVPKVPQSPYERKKDETLRLFNERMASHVRT